MTKLYRLSGRNNRHLYLTVLEVQESKIKVPTDSAHDKGLLPSLWIADFSVLRGHSRGGTLGDREGS